MKRETLEVDITIERLRNIRKTLENIYPPEQVQDWILNESPMQMARKRKKSIRETNQSVKEMLRTITEMGA